MSYFDATNVEPTKAYEPLPTGAYAFAVTDAEEITSEKTGNRMPRITFEVQQGDYAKRTITAWFNIFDKDAEKAGYAKAEFAGLLKAVGQANLKKLEDLVGKVFVGKVTVTKAKGDYGPGNKIKEYLPKEEWAEYKDKSPTKAGTAAAAKSDW